MKNIDKNFNIYQNIRVFIIGNGEEYKVLTNFVKENKLETNIFFLGYRNDSINFINACDLFIQPSISKEDMPLVVLTAMSLGKNIIATNFAGINQQIINGESGILINPDIKSITENIYRSILFYYKNVDCKMGVNAKKRYNNLFSEIKYGTSICNLYNYSITKKI